MTDQIYVDPNSGAAPQPGGFAGLEAAQKGFAINGETEEETRPSEYEAPGGNPEPKSVEELAALAEERAAATEEEKTEEEQLRLQAISNPQQVLSDLDESGNVPAPEGSEEEANNAASVEHEAIDPSNPDVVAEAYDPSKYGVDEVNAYLAEHPEERDAVIAAERNGKNRKTITGE